MNKILLILLCIFLPPVAVFIMRGISVALLMNIILVFVFFLPSVVHALWIALSDKKIGSK